jgi:pimeloyl-ACP methyl ester carboxylesterase
MIIDTRHGDSRNALHRQAPDVPRQVIAGTSHWPHLDKPYEFNRVLDSFL